MSKYSDKKRRQEEESERQRAFDECERKRIEKYNRKRAEERNARSNTRRGIRELSNPELVAIAHDLEKKVGVWKVAEVMGELRRRFVLALGLSAEIQKALL